MIPLELRDELMRWCDFNPGVLDESLPVSEVFGPTIQGEGPHMGRPCYFIRTGGCNLSCTWCDTPYSTGQHGIPLSTVPQVSAREAAEQIPSGSMVVITGGEPMMHQRRGAWRALLRLLCSAGCEVHIETNGSFAPIGDTDDLVAHFTVSPKLSAPMANPRHRPALQDWSDWSDRTIFKFVLDGDIDQQADDAVSLAAAHGCSSDRVWVMPEGATAEELTPRWAEVAQAAADRNINASHRLHALAWGDQKGH